MAQNFNRHHAQRRACYGMSLAQARRGEQLSRRKVVQFNIVPSPRTTQ